jgi:hypothetical protein
LEVVAVSDDGTQILLASSYDAARPTHSIVIDGRLNAAVRGKLDVSDRRESELSPKEIQARLRAGESAEQVAKAAKVPVSRIARYAGPVMSERERIIEQARGAVLHRAHGTEGGGPVGPTVDGRLAATAGIRGETVAWSARRRDDGAWIVGLNYVARGGARSASWLWQPKGRTITSLNALATRLAAPEPPKPKRAKPKPKPTASRSTASTRSGGAARTAANRPSVQAVPEVEQSTDQPQADTKPAAGRRATRIPVPSWDDVLLGVQAAPAARGRRRS